LEVTSPDPRGYGKVRSAAKYSGGVSVRTLKNWFKDGLPHFRLSTGTILVAYSDIDSWLEQFRVDHSKVDVLVDEIVEGLR
jgi:hypothetical protein